MTATRDNEAPPVRPRRRPGSATWILAGLILGVVVGLLLGDLMAPLAVLGRVYIKLIQITVLPYIFFALMYGVGGLEARIAKRLATRGLPVLLLFWAGCLAVYFAAATTFPERRAETFYDPNRFPGAGSVSFDWTSYIPSNPFASLADGVVPAVVVFSLCVGVALIATPRKEKALQALTFLTGLLGRINRSIIVYTAPIGVFALVGGTVGTMDVAQLKGIGVYFATYVFAALVLTVCVLPLIASALAGVSYLQLFRAVRAALLLGFSTGNPFITLPLVSDAVRDLLRQRGATAEQAAEMADTLTPIAYAVPITGRFAVFVFIPFAAWFADVTLTPLQYLRLIGSGILAVFGNIVLAVEFLLSELGLPAESINLFVGATPLITNIYGLVDSAAMTFFAVAAGALVLGIARPRLRKVLTAAAVGLVVVAVGAAALTAALRPLGDDGTGTYAVLQRMQVRTTVPARVYGSLAEAPAPQAPAPRARSVLEEIRRRRVLRVGYAPKAFPFSYFNGERELVGYEVERAYDLAVMLQCERVDFIPVDRNQFADLLDRGVVDTVMAAVKVTPALYQQVDFSDIYLTLHVAVVAPDTRADEYRTAQVSEAVKHSVVAVEQGSDYGRLLRAANPGFRIVDLADPLTFFDGGKADVLFTSAEEGSAYTLMHPQYEVVVPERQPPLYAAYPVKKGETDWALLLNNFITAEKEAGTSNRQYDYWVLGKNALPESPRWSIVRNVLHWQE